MSTCHIGQVDSRTATHYLVRTDARPHASGLAATFFGTRIVNLSLVLISLVLIPLLIVGLIDVGSRQRA